MTFLNHPRSSAFICGLILLSGCEVTQETESNTRKRQQSALNDPFNYNPAGMEGSNKDAVDPSDITGGGTTNLNKKALKRDLDALLGAD